MMSPLFRILSIVALLCAATLTACGGGGGGSATPAVITATSAPIVTTPTPAPTLQTQTISAGATAVTASFATIAAGYSASETLAAASSGSGSIATTFSGALPTGLPTVQSIRRSSNAIGATLTALAYFTFTPATTVTFPSTPAFSITGASAFTASASYYIGLYSATSGWLTILGPSTANGATVTFAAAASSTTFTAGTTYTYVFFSTATAIPTPSPTPTPTATFAPPNAFPVATAGPAFAYMSSAGTNTFASAIGTSSSYGYVIDVSTPYITASASAPTLTLDSTLAVKLGTSVTTFSDARLPLALALDSSAEHPSGNRPAPTRITDSALLIEQRDSAQLQADAVRIVTGATHSSARSAQSLRRAQSLGTTVGSTTSFWVNTTAIGQSGQSYTSVAASLGAVSNHAYVWVDASLSLSSQSIAAIGADFDNAYTSDVTHFGSPEFTSAAPGAQALSQPCDSAGVPIPNATPVPVLIAPPNGMHIVFVINPANLGSGVGGYFSTSNHFTQPIANCLSGQPKSNEASMIYLGYNTANPLQFELQEDMVRGSAHELQHLINFVNHGVLSPVLKFEDTWINEGLSMLAQDFAVHAMFPSVPNDVDDAVNAHAADFMTHPSRFSLTGFTGLENGTSFSFNCAGCYGASYLYQRYLYDRFGGDTYSKSMESNGSVSFANIQAATGVAVNVSIADFAVALINSGTGVSTDSRYMFANFNPYGTYVDQFGRTVKLQGPFVFNATIGQTTALNSYVGTFHYVQIQPTAGQGAGVTVSDSSGSFGLKAGLLQF